MTTTRDTIHKYIGLNIDYSSQGKVKIYMVYYIGNMLDDLLRIFERGIINTGRTQPF